MAGADRDGALRGAEYDLGGEYDLDGADREGPLREAELLWGAAKERDGPDEKLREDDPREAPELRDILEPREADRAPPEECFDPPRSAFAFCGGATNAMAITDANQLIFLYVFIKLLLRDGVEP